MLDTGYGPQLYFMYMSISSQLGMSSSVKTRLTIFVKLFDEGGRGVTLIYNAIVSLHMFPLG